jgi:hypothetical protein
MGSKLSEQENLLYKRMDEVLFYLWDPVGVSDIPSARDEYHSYLPHVFSLLRNNASESDIAKHLLSIERTQMGETGSLKRCKEVSEVLINWRESIYEKPNQAIKQMGKSSNVE